MAGRRRPVVAAVERPSGHRAQSHDLEEVAGDDPGLYLHQPPAPIRLNERSENSATAASERAPVR
jgi:hypothetical protein